LEIEEVSQDVVKTVKKHPYLIGGAAVVLVVGVFLLKRGSSEKYVASYEPAAMTSPAAGGGSSDTPSAADTQSQQLTALYDMYSEQQQGNLEYIGDMLAEQQQANKLLFEAITMNTPGVSEMQMLSDEGNAPQIATVTNRAVNTYTPGVDATSEDIRAQMAKNSAAWHTASESQKKVLAAQNQVLGKSVGGVYNSEAGTWAFPTATKSSSSSNSSSKNTSKKPPVVVSGTVARGEQAVVTSTGRKVNGFGEYMD